MKRLIQAATHPRDYGWGLRPWNRRSLAVLVGGVFYSGLGMIYIITEPAETRESALSPALIALSLPAWGIVFVFVGVLAIISSRWPPASETWGYQTLCGLAALWSGIYFFGVLTGGAIQSLSGSALWALLAFLWWVVAGFVTVESVEQHAVADGEV